MIIDQDGEMLCFVNQEGKVKLKSGTLILF